MRRPGHHLVRHPGSRTGSWRNQLCAPGHSQAAGRRQCTPLYSGASAAQHLGQHCRRAMAKGRDPAAGADHCRKHRTAQSCLGQLRQHAAEPDGRAEHQNPGSPAGPVCPDHHPRPGQDRQPGGRQYGAPAGRNRADIRTAAALCHAAASPACRRHGHRPPAQWG